MQGEHSKNFEGSEHVQIEKQSSVQLPSVLGESQAMRDLRQLLDEITDFDAPVLVTGEPGTGKQLVARTLHQKSQRRRHAFVQVNCSALTPQMLETALFGQENAASSAFSSAEGGMLYLAGIDSVPLGIQTKLLNVLQTGEFTPGDGNKPQRANVRIIAGTNTELAKKVQEGGFRQDLFYRLNLIEVILPPLRERGQDALILANHFLQHDAERFALPSTQLSDAAIDVLQRYPFPGNVRELKTLMRRALLLADSQMIEPLHLQPLPADHVQTGAHILHFNTAKQQVIDAFEKAFLAQRLHQTGGNISQAARESGMYKANFIQKMKKHGLHRVDFLKK